MSQFVIGLDLGTTSEPTGLCEYRQAFGVRHLARLPPGTPFGAIAASLGSRLFHCFLTVQSPSCTARLHFRFVVTAHTVLVFSQFKIRGL